MHNLEIVNGKVAFASRREPAWHGLGTVINTDHMSLEEIMSAAHLDKWNVRTMIAQDIVPTGFNFGSKSPVLVVRDNPYGQTFTDENGIERPVIDILNNNATERYAVLSNEAAFAFADSLVNAEGLQPVNNDYGKISWETAGAINGGRQVFGSLSLERSITIDENGANDEVKMYLLVTTSHDGSIKFSVLFTMVRVVCQNTLNFALKNAVQSYKIKHTAKMEDRAKEIRTMMGLNNKYVTEFQTTAEKLHSRELTDNEFLAILKHSNIFGEEPDPSEKNRTTRWKNNIDESFGLWRGKTQENIAGTAWAAVNVLTELDQWGRTIRAGNVESFLSAGAGFDKTTNDTRNTVLETVMGMAFA